MAADTAAVAVAPKTEVELEVEQGRLEVLERRLEVEDGRLEVEEGRQKAA